MKGQLGTIFGMQVIMYPGPTIETQAIKIKDSFQWITDECRERVNAYLLDRFGTQKLMFASGDKIFMSKEQIVMLKLNNLETQP